VADATDPSELLHVDVDQLAGPGPLVTERLLEPDPAKAAQPDPGQDPGDRRERHRERLGDLGRGHPQSAQLHDHRDPIRRRPVGNAPRRRRPVQEPSIAITPPADPLARTAHTDPGSPRSLRQRPTILNNTTSELAPPAPAERRVTVKIHPSLLGTEPPWSALSLQGGPDGTNVLRNYI